MNNKPKKKTKQNHEPDIRKRKVQTIKYLLPFSIVAVWIAKTFERKYNRIEKENQEKMPTFISSI